jgi:hypothetical protein
MSEMNELEKLLLSWTPRRPSKAFEERLFGAAGSAPAEPLPPLRLSWLAPAAVAVLLLCVLFSQRLGGDLTGPSHSAPMVAMILSNQSAATYLAGNGQSEQNNLPADAFKWSGAGRAAARLTAFSPGKRED